MKKTLIAVAAAAALTTSAFAEITFGAWLRTVAAPVANDGKDTVAAYGNSWGGSRFARVNVNATAEDGKVGYNMCVGAGENGLENVTDTAIWAKPVDTVKVSYGMYDQGCVGGGLEFGAWNWIRPTSTLMMDDDNILMTRNTGKGAMIEVTPVDGLYAYTLIPFTSEKKKAEDVYKNVRLGAAYDLNGIGKIKAQLLLDGASKVESAAATAGKWTDKNGKDTTAAAIDAALLVDVDTAAGYQDAIAAGYKYTPSATAVTESKAYLNKTVEAEFDLTSVENLWLAASVQVKLYDEPDSHKADQKMRFTVAATYQVNDELKFNAYAIYKMFQKGKNDGGHDGRFAAAFGADYNLGDGMSLVADLRYLGKEDDAEKSDSMAFMVGVTKSISSNGFMGVGFQGQTHSGDWSLLKNNATEDKLTWCVPVVIQVSF